jgi:coenzyme F420-reducing hydrogenase delta subunit
VKEILKTTGISPERVQMFNCSAAEGQLFASEVLRISDIIVKLGNNSIKKLSNSSNKEKDSSSKNGKVETD